MWPRPAVGREPQQKSDPSSFNWSFGCAPSGHQSCVRQLRRATSHSDAAPAASQLPLHPAAAEDLAAEDDDRSPFREDDDVEASDACLWTLRGFSTVTAFAGLLVVVVNAIERL